MSLYYLLQVYITFTFNSKLASISTMFATYRCTFSISPCVHGQKRCWRTILVCQHLFYNKSKTISRVMSWMIIYLERLLPAASSDPPENESGKSICSLFGLASDGVYMATVVTNSTVVSYTAFPPLPHSWRYISVALSLESPPPDVIRHPALWSPDFPHLPDGSRDHLSYFYIQLLYIKTASAHKFSTNRIIWQFIAANA